MNAEYEIIKINDSTWRIENSGVRFFLLEGTEKALLIDTGMTTKNAREIAESLTSLPLSLLNTHADIDHISANGEFIKPYMHPCELYNYKSDITPVWDGDIINLGQRELEIIHIPGHTPGSIAVLDKSRRILFSGDTVQCGAIFMFGEQRNVGAYLKSLIRLEKRKDEFDEIFPSHAALPLKKEIIAELIEAAKKIISGEIETKKSDFMGRPVEFFDAGCAEFLLDIK